MTRRCAGALAGLASLAAASVADPARALTSGPCAAGQYAVTCGWCPDGAHCASGKAVGATSNGRVQHPEVVLLFWQDRSDAGYQWEPWSQVQNTPTRSQLHRRRPRAGQQPLLRLARAVRRAHHAAPPLAVRHPLHRAAQSLARRDHDGELSGHGSGVPRQPADRRGPGAGARGGRRRPLPGHAAGHVAGDVDGQQPRVLPRPQRLQLHVGEPPGRAVLVRIRGRGAAGDDLPRARGGRRHRRLRGRPRRRVHLQDGRRARRPARRHLPVRDRAVARRPGPAGLLVRGRPGLRHPRDVGAPQLPHRQQEPGVDRHHRRPAPGLRRGARRRLHRRDRRGVVLRFGHERVDPGRRARRRVRGRSGLRRQQGRGHRGGDSGYEVRSQLLQHGDWPVVRRRRSGVSRHERDRDRPGRPRGDRRLRAALVLHPGQSPRRALRSSSAAPGTSSSPWATTSTR